MTAKNKNGDQVDVEVDIVGKYTEKSVNAYLRGMLGEAIIPEKITGKIVEQKMQQSS